MLRRRFLQSIAATGAGLGIASLVSCESEKASGKKIGQVLSAKDSSVNYFPQSILSAEPRAQSVVLWTRVEDKSSSANNKPVIVQLALDEAFESLLLQYETSVNSESDGCISIKVTQLESSRNYYYRFLYLKNGEYYSSKVGRTKTAPAADEERSLKFAQVCCQDYVGRYYNSYWKLLEQDDLDFVLFLGDYIYETTRDPRFQTDDGRKVVFRDQDGAIQLGGTEAPFYAASSVDNYRQLYQIYRSDPLLQKVHERFPMIAIWDDHEFADDSFGANSTHYAGRRNEKDLARKANSEQAFFEYMPIDLTVAQDQASKPLARDPKNRFPETQIYRGFNFGKNLDLVVSDFRTYRPDHLIPEDAFPGTIIFNETALQLLLSSQGIDFASIKQHFIPYIDIEGDRFKQQNERLRQLLTSAYQQEGLSLKDAQQKVGAVLSGNLSIPFVNQWLAAVEQKIDLQAADGVGFSYELLGKLTLFGEVGSRYFIVKQAYDLLSAATYTFNKQSQDALGERQELWLKDQLMSSNAHWKFMANSVAMNSFLLDLSAPELKIPKPFNQNFYMNVDNWDGFPNKREELLENLKSVSNLVLLSGDIHAALVGSHKKTIKEFTAPSLSSSTQKKMIGDVAKTNPVLSQLPDLATLLKSANDLILKANQQLEFAEMTKNGFVVHELNHEQLRTHYYLLPEAFVSKDHYQSPNQVLAVIQQKTFITKSKKYHQ